MGEFVRQHASAIFGLLGALGGGLLSFSASWFLRKRDHQLELWGKLLERRIQAHEKVIEVALQMRVVFGVGGLDEDGGVLRAPSVLSCREAFEQWFQYAMEQSGAVSTWLSVAAKRELNFVQDYLVTLHVHLSGVPSELYPKAGLIVRQDFIDLSSELERKAFSFFRHEMWCLKLTDLESWHKYPQGETEPRLKATQLLQRWQDIVKLSKPN